MDVLVSGKTSFKVEVPYLLGETGPKGPKPILVYLHGRGETIETFKAATSRFHDLDAYHLYIQGPYADKTVTASRERIGYAWHLYNHKQGSLVKSLEYTAEFIQEVVDGVRPFLNITRLCLIGYSMGGSQAAYFAFTRWKHTNELIAIGSRLDTGILNIRSPHVGHIGILGVQGEQDAVVEARSQADAFADLADAGIDARLRLVPGGHPLSEEAIRAALDWLATRGYKAGIPQLEQS
jgi:predicted esterase